MFFQFKSIVLAAVCLMTVTTSLAEPLQITLTDQSGQVLEDAVVELLPIDGPLAVVKQKPVMVAQQELMFVPFVTAVQQGTSIEFPNQDKTRHHVYSFSPAKVFELKLYSGKPEQPVLFDKAGVVALGCNIHDYMQAFVYVGSSPYLAVSNSQGIAVLNAVPAGRVQVKLWHPWQVQEIPPQELSLPAAQPLVFSLTVTHQQKPQKPKKGFGASYN
jgi:plastocyanin